MTGRLLQRLIRDDHGQDLVEYALLAALVGVVGLVAWINITEGMGTAYDCWVGVDQPDCQGVQDLWELPNPQ